MGDPANFSDPTGLEPAQIYLNGFNVTASLANMGLLLGKQDDAPRPEVYRTQPTPSQQAASESAEQQTGTALQVDYSWWQALWQPWQEATRDANAEIRASLASPGKVAEMDAAKEPIPGTLIIPDGMPRAKPIAGALVVPSGGEFGAISYSHKTPHTGVDYATPEGTVVRAALPATVKDVYNAATSGAPACAGLSYCGGRVGSVVLSVPEVAVAGVGQGITVTSKHVYPLVNKGDRVQAGDPIGVVNLSGRTTGFHVHQEVRDATNTPRDPTFLLP